jgi:hypothetical protein
MYAACLLSVAAMRGGRWWQWWWRQRKQQFRWQWLSAGIFRRRFTVKVRTGIAGMARPGGTQSGRQIIECSQ